MYMEAYTSLLSYGLSPDGLFALEKLYGKPITVADRIICCWKLRIPTLPSWWLEILLDVKVKEPSLESLCRGKKVYEPPRFMTINTAVEQMLEVGQNHKEAVYGEDTLCVGLARVGCEHQKLVSGSMKQLLDVDFGPPLHCLIIVGDTHLIEEEMPEFYMVDKS